MLFDEIDGETVLVQNTWVKKHETSNRAPQRPRKETEAEGVETSVTLTTASGAMILDLHRN